MTYRLDFPTRYLRKVFLFSFLFCVQYKRCMLYNQWPLFSTCTYESNHNWQVDIFSKTDLHSTFIWGRIGMSFPVLFTECVKAQLYSDFYSNSDFQWCLQVCQHNWDCQQTCQHHTTHQSKYSKYYQYSIEKTLNITTPDTTFWDIFVIFWWGASLQAMSVMPAYIRASTTGKRNQNKNQNKVVSGTTSQKYNMKIKQADFN